MLQEILEIVNSNTTRRFKKILTQEPYWSWIVEKTKGYNCTNDLERIYIIVNGPPPVCEYGNSYKFVCWAVGYYSCGPASTCLCKKEEVSRKVRESKQRYSESKRQEINRKRKQTTKKRYGVDNVFQHHVIKEKIKETNLSKFGAENPNKCEEVRKKIEETNLARYGTKAVLSSPKIKEKIKQTNRKKYGAESVLQSEEVKQKIKQTLIQKYKVDNPLKSKIIRKKIEITNLQKHGSKNPFGSEDIKEKIYQTNEEKYGTKYPNQSDMLKEKKKKKFLEKILSRCPGYTPLFNEWLGVQIDHKWKCQRCGTEFLDNIDNGKLPRCPKCYPPVINSIAEKEIALAIKEKVKILENSRKIIPPYELDIYIPDKKLAIEYCGLHWHSELNGKDRNYHYNKYLLCKGEGIQLITIFEDEYKNNPTLIMNRLFHKLGFVTEKLYARNCEVQSIESNVAEDFYDIYHVQGGMKSHIDYGLYHRGELVGCMSFSKSRYSKNYEYELTRFATSKSVVGGASKLFSFFIKMYNPESVVSYCDLRWNNGNTYKKMGFSFSHISKPNYWYIDRSRTKREHRIKYQKHKLKNLLEEYDSNLSEWENMKLNGYDRIWDCGNSVWVWKA